MAFIAEKLIEVIGTEIIKEICDIWGYKSHLEHLKETVSTIRKVFLDAEARRELSNEERDYIEKLKNAVYDADDLFDEFLTLAELKQLKPLSKGSKFFEKVRCFFSSKSPMGEAYRMSCQVKGIKKRLNAIADNHTKFGFNANYDKPIGRRREETYSYVDVKDIVGRENDVKEVVSMLLDNDVTDQDFRFISVVGVGGIGKTALAQLVYNDEKIKVEFPTLRLWVCVSDQDGEQFDVKTILCKILELVDCQKFDGSSTMELVQNQFQAQLKGKKYFLVLDDVWNEDRKKWLELEKLLMLGQEGSRIVVTTRSEMTATIIGDKNAYKLEGLSQENSWQLFEMTAFSKGDKEENHPEFVEIGKKIVENCYNIPLALKVVGSLLYSQDISKWHMLEESGLAKVNKFDDKILSILKLSYDNLESSLKGCFSHCAVFPKDFEIKKEMLISLWMAHGCIVQSDEDQRVEEAAEEQFLTLLRRCFFQDVKKDEYGCVNSVKIHDLMHDVSQEVGRKELSVVSSITDNMIDKTRHMSFVGKENATKISRKAHTFVHPHQYHNFVRTQVGKWTCLRVLELQRLGLDGSLDSIGKLLHLRYLNLSDNEFDVLPDSITKLHNLQTLILDCCSYLKELPKNFSRLVKLRHLDLQYCKRLTSMPLGMDKLTNLRVLPFFVVGMGKIISSEKQYGGELKDLKALISIKGKLHIKIGENYRSVGDINERGGYLKNTKHLTEVKIVFDGEVTGCVDQEPVMEKMEPHVNLKGFILEGYEGTQIPRWGRAEDNWAMSFPYLVKINLEYCCNLEQMPLLSKLPYLKSLELVFLEKLEHMEINTSTADVTTFFPSLESLKIMYLKSLKGWWREDSAAAADDHTLRRTLRFPRLCQLSIRHCPNLTSFPVCPSLEDLEFCGNNEMLQIVVNTAAGNSQDDVRLRKVVIDNVSSLNSIHSPCLTSLNIKDNKEMESLSEVEEAFKSFASSLRSLTIWGCCNLRRLSGGLEYLTALESLKVSSNNQLIISEEDENEDGMPWKSLHQNLRSLELHALENMTSLPKGMQHLTSLQRLQLFGCHNIEGLPEWISCLSSLQSLSVEYCIAFKSLPGSMQNLTSLQKLVIQHCCPGMEKEMQINQGRLAEIQFTPIWS